MIAPAPWLRSGEAVVVGAAGQSDIAAKAGI